MGRSIQKAAFRVFSKIVPKTRWGDKIFCYFNFLIRNGRLPTSNRNFNDRIHFNKVSEYALRPEVAITSCKYLAKPFINGITKRDRVVPTLAILWTKEDILGYNFPERCAIKSTHGSGQNIIRQNGEIIDMEKITGWLSMNYYSERREVNYKFLRPGVIVEPLVFDNSSPDDFKIFCINGVAKLIQIDSDRKTSHRRSFYDTEWNKLPFSLKVPIATGDHARPKCLDDMLNDASHISELFDLVRIDFYSDGSNYYLGEVTHFHGNAWEKFIPHGSEIHMNAILFEARS